MGYLLPSILMVVMALSHTAAIVFLRKRMQMLDKSTQDGLAKAKNLKFVIFVLYAEIPLLTLVIWFVVAPALANGGN